MNIKDKPIESYILSHTQNLEYLDFNEFNIDYDLGNNDN
tara:strand:- start:58 stop:174 length:117 start_codon:yes stop_codon:yes gene_type:complete